MIKRLLVFAFIVTLLFTIAVFVHNHFVAQTLSFQLWHVYLFHAIAAFLVYALVEGVASIMPNNAGYAYLGLMFLKVGLFLLIFKNSVFQNESLTQTERFALVIPLFLFLSVEAVAVTKLLNSK